MKKGYTRRKEKNIIEDFFFAEWMPASCDSSVILRYNLPVPLAHLKPVA